MPKYTASSRIHAHPHRAVLSIPCDCLSHWGDYRLSIAVHVAFEPAVDVSIAVDEWGGVGVVLWEGEIRLGGSDSGPVAGSDSGSSSLAAVISGSEGCRAERAMSAALQHCTASGSGSGSDSGRSRGTGSGAMDNSLSITIPQSVTTSGSDSGRSRGTGSGAMDNSLSITIPQSVTTTATTTVTTTATGAVSSLSAAAAAVLDLSSPSPTAPTTHPLTDSLSVRLSRVPAVPGPDSPCMDPVAVEVLRAAGQPARLALAHAVSRRTAVTALSLTHSPLSAGAAGGAAAVGGGCGRVAGDTFTAGDVHSLPAGVQQAMVACAELSRELHRHCSRADSGVGGAGGGGVDCHVSQIGRAHV